LWLKLICYNPLMNLWLIRQKIRKDEYDLSEHAHRERQAEQITMEEIEQTLYHGGIIEEYLDDPRGESCLIGSKSLHIVCGWRGERLLVVTVYRPKKPVWINWKTRAKELKSRG
jgi:hypothetical protein